MVIEIPGLETDKGLDFSDGDVSTYLRFLRLFVTNIPESLGKMRNVSQETLMEYAATVHSVKSNCEIIGAEEARVVAKQLEAMAKGGDLSGVLVQNKAFIEYVEKLLESIRDWLKKTGAGS